MMTRLWPILLILPVLATATPAAAQFPGQEPPCLKDFLPLRNDADKRAQAIRDGVARKVPPKELCGLFSALVHAEEKVVKFAADNSVWCGIPPQAVEQMKANHKKTVGARTRVCQVAAAPPRPAGPSLGDALGARAVPDASNVKPGRGTFDTLTGSPLAR